MLIGWAFFCVLLGIILKVGLDVPEPSLVLGKLANINLACFYPSFSSEGSDTLSTNYYSLSMADYFVMINQLAA